MSEHVSSRHLKTLVYLPYVAAALVVLFIFGRYVLRLGDPPGPPAQGAEIPSMRGSGIFEIEHPVDARTSELVLVSSKGLIARSLLVDGMQKRSNSTQMRSGLLDAVTQFQQTWCHQTVLPPTPAPTADVYQVRLSCTLWTGRIFYFAKDELPPVLVDVLHEAPPLRDP